MIVLAQLLEGPVGAVGHVGVKGLGALVDQLGIKHHAHGDSAQNGANHHHDGQGDHALGEALAGVLHLVDVGGDLLTTAHRKDQDGQRGEIAHVEVGQQCFQAEVHGDELGTGVDDRSGKHHNDVQDGHNKHAAAGDGGQALQGVQAGACHKGEEQQHSQRGDLHINGGEAVVLLRVAEHSPAQGLQTAGALAGDVGDVAGPVGPAGVVGHLGAHGVEHPGADAAAGVLKGGAQLAHHQSIGDEIQGKHQDPAEDHLDAVEIHEAIQHIAEAPNRGKRHKRKHVPLDLFVFVHFRTSLLNFQFL